MVYDYKKTIIKGVKYAAICGLTGFITMYDGDPKYAAIIPLVMMGLNYLKHKD